MVLTSSDDDEMCEECEQNQINILLTFENMKSTYRICNSCHISKYLSISDFKTIKQKSHIKSLYEFSTTTLSTLNLDYETHLKSLASLTGLSKYNRAQNELSNWAYILQNIDSDLKMQARQGPVTKRAPLKPGEEVGEEERCKRMSEHMVGKMGVIQMQLMELVKGFSMSEVFKEVQWIKFTQLGGVPLNNAEISGAEQPQMNIGKQCEAIGKMGIGVPEVVRESVPVPVPVTKVPVPVDKAKPQIEAKTSVEVPKIDTKQQNFTSQASEALDNNPSPPPKPKKKRLTREQRLKSKGSFPKMDAPQPNPADCPPTPGQVETKDPPTKPVSKSKSKLTKRQSRINNLAQPKTPNQFRGRKSGDEISGVKEKKSEVKSKLNFMKSQKHNFNSEFPKSEVNQRKVQKTNKRFSEIKNSKIKEGVPQIEKLKGKRRSEIIGGPITQESPIFEERKSNPAMKITVPDVLDKITDIEPISSSSSSEKLDGISSPELPDSLQELLKLKRQRRSQLAMDAGMVPEPLKLMQRHSLPLEISPIQTPMQRFDQFSPMSGMSGISEISGVHVDYSKISSTPKYSHFSAQIDNEIDVDGKTWQDLIDIALEHASERIKRRYEPLQNFEYDTLPTTSIQVSKMPFGGISICEMDEFQQVSGRGISITSRDKLSEGIFNDGKMLDGYGQIYFENGIYYNGEFVDGELHGHGLAKYTDGSWYEGQFFKGIREGDGKWMSPSGLLHTGTFQDEQLYGLGTITKNDGTFIKATFIDGKKQGYGICRKPQDFSYEGHYKNSQFEGIGIYTWASGAKFEGHFKSGQQDGMGIYTHLDGEVQIGDWHHGGFNGLVICRKGGKERVKSFQFGKPVGGLDVSKYRKEYEEVKKGERKIRGSIKKFGF